MFARAKTSYCVRNWVFPDCNSSWNSPMATKCNNYSNDVHAKSMSSVKFQGHTCPKIEKKSTKAYSTASTNQLSSNNTKNDIYGENLKLKLCTCAQSMALGTWTKFQLEIFIRRTISAAYKFPENILESSQNVSETTPRSLKVWRHLSWPL